MARDKRANNRTMAPARMQSGLSLTRPIEQSLETLAGDVAEHSARHENGGADELNLVGLSGLLADPQTPAAHKVSHQNGGADELNVAGLNGELADAQPPKAHAASHAAAGSDPLLSNVSGTFTTVDGKTVTVTNGIITAIV